MNDKEKLLSFLYKAKEDYEASITISKQIFNKKKRYKALNTHLGLAHYFQETFGFKNAVFEHFKSFKPIVEDENLLNEWYWYPIECNEGFILRLNIINQALRLYQNLPQDEIPFILIDEVVSDFDLYPDGYIPNSYHDKKELFNYMDLNIDKYMDGILDKG